MTTTPDLILTALGGSIPAARDYIAALFAEKLFHTRQERAICDLALRALGAMERPDGGGGDLHAAIQKMADWIGDHWVRKDWGIEGEKLNESMDLLHGIARLVGFDISKGSIVNPAHAPADCRTYFCAEYERLAKAHDELGKQAMACERDRCVQADEIATLTRERDASRADQAAMARRQLEAFGSDALNLRALPADAPVQVVRDIIAEKLRARIAALPAEKPAETVAVPLDREALVRWLCGNDTGMSSKCIARAVSGEATGPVHEPADMSDFGRCKRLVESVQGVRDRLSMVAALSPQWRRIVEKWDAIVAKGRPALDWCLREPDPAANPPASPDGSTATADAEARIELSPGGGSGLACLKVRISQWHMRSLGTPRDTEGLAIMRSLAADAAKAQAEVERLTTAIHQRTEAFSIVEAKNAATIADLRAKLAEAEQRQQNAEGIAAQLSVRVERAEGEAKVARAERDEARAKLAEAEVAKPAAVDDAQEGDERMGDWPLFDYEKAYSPIGATSLETAVYHLCRRALRVGGK